MNAAGRSRSAGLAIVALALVISGCGGGSSPKIGGNEPSGWQRVVEPYQGNLVASLALPSGWTSTSEIVQGGAIGNFFVPQGAPGSPTSQGYARPGSFGSGPATGFIAYTAHPHGDVLQTYRARRQQLGASGKIRNYQAHVQIVAVPGAAAARRISDSYINPNGPGRSVELLVRTRSGAQIDVMAAVSRGSPSSFDPAAIIDSFRLQKAG